MQVRTTKYIYLGDEKEGRKLIGLANIQLMKLRTLMTLGKLSIYTLSIYNKVGACIKVTSVNGYETAEIFYPLVPDKDKPKLHKPSQITKKTTGYYIWFDIVEDENIYYPSLETDLAPMLDAAKQFYLPILFEDMSWLRAKIMDNEEIDIDEAAATISDVWHDAEDSKTWEGVGYDPDTDVTLKWIKWGFTSTKVVTYTIGNSEYEFTEVTEVTKYKYKVEWTANGTPESTTYDSDDYGFGAQGWSDDSNLHHQTEISITSTLSCPELSTVSVADGIVAYLLCDNTHYFFHSGKSYTYTFTEHPFTDVMDTFQDSSTEWYSIYFPPGGVENYMNVGAAILESLVQDMDPVLIANETTIKSFDNAHYEQSQEYSEQDEETGETTPGSWEREGSGYGFNLIPLPQIFRYGIQGALDEGSKIEDLFVLGIVKKEISDWSDFQSHSSDIWYRSTPYPETLQYFVGRSEDEEEFIIHLSSKEYAVDTWDGINYIHYFEGTSGKTCNGVIEVTYKKYPVEEEKIETGPAELVEWWYADPNADWIIKTEA